MEYLQHHSHKIFQQSLVADYHQSPYQVQLQFHRQNVLRKHPFDLSRDVKDTNVDYQFTSYLKNPPLTRQARFLAAQSTGVAVACRKGNELYCNTKHLKHSRLWLLIRIGPKPKPTKTPDLTTKASLCFRT